MEKQVVERLEAKIAEGYKNTTGVLVNKNGETVYERYFSGLCEKDATHVFSVTKSVFSALIGIAIDKGVIESVDMPVLDFFPDYTIKQREKTIQKVTLRHLLTMTAPYKCKSEPNTKYFSSPDWVKTALDYLGGNKELGAFRYSPIMGTHILSGVLRNASGEPTDEFAKRNLFTPLGISFENIGIQSKEEQFAFYYAKKHKSGWVTDEQGRNTASWGLTLTPRELARIGELYRMGGEVNGKRLISKEWINESTTEKSRWDDMRYGYLWWIIDKDERAYAALGDGGNTIYVNEKRGEVVVITGAFIPRAADRIDLIREYIEPFI